MKRSGLLAALLALVCSPVSADVPPAPDALDGVPVAFMVDLGSGQTLYQRNADRRFLPASLTKVMTAYVAFEQMRGGKLPEDRLFTVSPEIARQWHGRGTSMYLDAGEKIATRDLLHGIMTASANDAAVVLATGYAGSVPGWTALMNHEAKRLGMTRSHFNTPNGWPDGGRTEVTARDMARLAQAMIVGFPQYYATYSGKTKMEWNHVALFSHEPVTGVVPGADGIKTGFTHEAGYNLLASAERDGRRLVAVIGGARTEAQRASAGRAFLEWGFSRLRKAPLFAPGQQVVAARVQGGAQTTVALTPGRAVYASVPANGSERVVLRAIYRGPVRAPVAKGQRIGDLEIRVGSLPPGRVALYAAASVGRASPMDRIINGFKNLFS